jgi:hypothetical protein
MAAGGCGCLPGAGLHSPVSPDGAPRFLFPVQRVQASRRHDWVVYAKTPLARPAAVPDSRYTHRTAIGNERLVAIEGDKVLLRVRADGTGGNRTIAMDGVEFVGRFLQHVLPEGFKRIRHYGLLAPARQLLAMRQANPRAAEDAQAFVRRVAAIEIDRCPHCKTGRWRVVEQVLRDPLALAALVPMGCGAAATACRGPP